MELLDILQHRRSVRTYAPGAVTQEQLRSILQAGMLSPSGKALRPWEFIVVQDPEKIRALAGCRTVPMAMFQTASCAIVVVGDGDRSDVWVEDCSVAMAQMHLMADALGLGSCWVQGRLREAADGRTAEEYVRGLLGFPASCHLEAILTLGPIDRHPEPHSLEDLPMDKVHYETF